MATIGILGTGRMGVRLAEAFAKAGAQVILGSRDPRRAERIAAGLKKCPAWFREPMRKR